MSEFATYLKVGTAMIVLSMIEDGYSIPHIDLEEPVKAIRDISRDTTLKKTVKLEDGRELTALEIQQVFWERAGEYLQSQPPNKIFSEIHDEWGRVFCKSLVTLPCNWSEKSTGLQKNGYWKIIWLKRPVDGTTHD